MSPTCTRKTYVALYAATILTSAFLIFQVQPLISKSILPWFGGTPGVWTTCMLFFQVVLFAGYAYAHASIRWLPARWQAGVHVLLLIAACSLLPIEADDAWKPLGNEIPTWRILGLLAATVGLPYFLLSSTGPLLQAWFGTTRPTASPYRLYALSNIGSVLGLITYPFLFEPWLDSAAQAWWWSVGFGGFALVCACCAIDLARRARSSNRAETDRDHSATAPTWNTMTLWFVLSATASVMLLATTNQVCLDVAVIPFLWVLPLTLYLASFILCFDRAWWYPRRAYATALAGAIVCLTAVMQAGGNSSLATQVVVHFTTLFFCCMVCHGELVRLRPAPQYLTTFYLSSSAGGAVGGLLVGVVAPLCFNNYLELPLALIAGCGIVLWVLLSDRDLLWEGTTPRWTWAWVLLAAWGGLRLIGMTTAAAATDELAATRNFYGVLKIVDVDTHDPKITARRMVHGRIVHGQQFLAADRLQEPTTYYGTNSGVGLYLDAMPADYPRNVGMVGLGVGTLATYGRDGDRFRFYEINPDVIRLAKDHFTFLKDSTANVELVLGDARLSLERESPQNFDLLVLDAFSSDSVPAHLLTREAFDIYVKHLKPGGVLAFHVTNRHFDLDPVIRGAAQQLDWQTAKVRSPAAVGYEAGFCDWMLVASDATAWNSPALAAPIAKSSLSPRSPILWTDRFNHVVGVMK